MSVERAREIATAVQNFGERNSPKNMEAPPKVSGVVLFVFVLVRFDFRSVLVRSVPVLLVFICFGSLRFRLVCVVFFRSASCWSGLAARFD